MGRTGMMHKFGMCAAILVSMGFLLGGCKADQKRAAAAQAEAQEYREKVATLEQANRDKDSRIADLENRLATMQQAQQAAPPPVTTFNPGSGGNTGSMSGSREFSNDAQGRPRALLSGDILFDSGRATLKPTARQRLDTLANEIKRNYAGRTVLVEGHTDTDPIRKSSFGSNQALSEARAQAVRQYLIQKGISSNRIEAVGYGSSRPRSTKAASRRVEIVITN
ncbi:MAG: OmpA family protein [Phycisphaeraceae bacterium]|nr:OmpA family protein [Phycisphaeraceae bacterium]